MTRRELAEWLSAAVRRRRLERIGEHSPGEGVAFEHLPETDQQTWLDVAETVFEWQSSNHPIERIQDLCRDWIHYAMQVRDPEERKSWQRCVLIEMKVEIAKLGKECDLERVQ